MNITIKGFWLFKRFLNGDQDKQLHMDEGTLHDALLHLAKELGQEFAAHVFEGGSKRVKRAVLIMLNGQNYLNLSKKLYTPLKDGDEITFLPVVTGG